MERYINKVVHADALQLLGVLPTASVDAVITDAMYGTSKDCRYDWGVDPAKGDPVKHWLYHQPIYEECLRVLKPGGALAWAQGAKFCDHFPDWFGKHRVWTLTRFRRKGIKATGHVWIVQTREQKPIEFPQRDALVVSEDMGPLARMHPCVKPVEELAFMIEALTKPGDVVLDCFCGLGSTLQAAQALDRRWIGCDISRRYCQISMARLQGRISSGTASQFRPRSHDTRDDLNFYPTPPCVTEELLGREDFGSVVWEPACGDGAISKVLEAAGYTVLSSDIKDRGYGEVLDFFQTQRTVESIVTNPDYSRAEEFVRKALASATFKVAMFLRASFFESQRRAPLFAEHPPKRIYVFARRVSLYPGGERGESSGGQAM
jgi:DNA modification methylase